VPSAGLADGDFLRRLTEIEAKSLEARSRRSVRAGTIIFATAIKGAKLSCCAPAESRSVPGAGVVSDLAVSTREASG